MMNKTNDNYGAILLTLYKGKYDSCEDMGGAREYRVIGEFDYLRVQSLDADMTTEAQFREMWLKTEEISRNLHIGESCHNLYAIGKKDREYANGFWLDRSYPFLFMSMLQLKMGGGVDFNLALERIETFLNALVDTYSYDIKISIYYSLDSCDYILFLKSKSYDAGSKIIQGMPSISYDNKNTLNYYCYSLCGIDIQKYLEFGEQQVINKIMICFVIKDFAVFNKWLTALKEKFSDFDMEVSFKDNRNRQFSYSRLGNEDVCINIMNCNLALFLEELGKRGGLLNDSNPLFVEGLMKLRLHFDSTQYYEGVETNIIENPRFKTLIERFSECVKGDLEDILYPTTKKALIEVLNSCSYFEREYFVKDIQICVQNSFDIFLSKFEEFLRWKNDPNPEIAQNCSQVDFNHSVIEYINGIMSVVNGALHTDRMFFQAPGFNAVLYDIPAKLLAFYTAFVKKLSDILNDNEEKEFAYLLCPDLYLRIVLIKLFDNVFDYPTKRLLKGSIPVKSIFEPKKLMVELAHEVAHCVGDQTRMRQMRLQYSIAMFSNTLVYYLFSAENLDDRNILGAIFSGTGKEDKIERFRKNVSLHLGEMLYSKFSANKREKDEFEYYQVKTKSFFKGAIKEIIDSPDELFGYIEEEYLKIFRDGRQNLVEEVKNVYALTRIMERNLSVFLLDKHLAKMIDGIHSLTNESYADLIMYKILGLSGKEYIRLFYDANKELLSEKNIAFLYENATGERILSVLEAMGEDIEVVCAGEDDLLYNIYLGKVKEFKERDNLLRNKNIFFPRNIILDNKYYLISCLTKIQEQKLEEQFESIRTLYKEVTEQDIYSSAQSIFKIVYEMRLDIEKS